MDDGFLHPVQRYKDWMGLPFHDGQTITRLSYRTYGGDSARVRLEMDPVTKATHVTAYLRGALDECRRSKNDDWSAIRNMTIEVGWFIPPEYRTEDPRPPRTEKLDLTISPKAKGERGESVTFPNLMTLSVLVEPHPRFGTPEVGINFRGDDAGGLTRVKYLDVSGCTDLIGAFPNLVYLVLSDRIEYISLPSPINTVCPVGRYNSREKFEVALGKDVSIEDADLCSTSVDSVHHKRLFGQRGWR